jgi:hypothetical protein
MLISHRCPPRLTYQYKILYVGRNIALCQFLKAGLQARDCYLAYCPALWLAHVLLKSDVYYSLCLFDELPEATGVELVEFTRTLRHRVCTPMIVVKELIKDEAA